MQYSIAIAQPLSQTRAARRVEIRQLVEGTKIIATCVSRRFSWKRREEISASFFSVPCFLFFSLFCGAMSNERTLPRRRAAASVVSYTREGAKKWSDQCQISAFTASVCDPQRQAACANAPAQKLLRKGGPWITYLPTSIRSQKRALSARYRMLIIRGRCRAISLCNEQKMGITKPRLFVRRGGSRPYFVLKTCVRTGTRRFSCDSLAERIGSHCCAKGEGKNPRILQSLLRKSVKSLYFSIVRVQRCAPGVTSWRNDEAGS